jgi:hypothetical protein
MVRNLYPLRFVADTGTDGGGLKRPAKVHQDRDAWVLGHLTSAIRCPGDRTEALFNVPGRDLDERSARALMRAGDLVLVTTRPPANDRRPETDEERWYARKGLIYGDNWLERQILERTRQFIGWCNRKFVVLTPEGAACLAPMFRDRAAIHFHITDDAAYRDICGRVPHLDGPGVHPSQIHWQNRKPTDIGASTAGYILHLKHLWAGGPDCLLMFSMSGPTTYGFVSAVAELLDDGLLNGFVCDASELIFVEISSGARNVPLTPATTQGHPTFWRHWRFAWNRGGRLVDWPASAPMRGRDMTSPA